MGKLRKDVVKDVGASNVKVESIDESRVVSVNGAQSSLQPVP